jgi:FkbM family methyltransferase
MKWVKLVGKDFKGIWFVCRPSIAIKWLFHILFLIPQIIRSKNLHPADIAMGDGPFKVRHHSGGIFFSISGDRVFSGIREMYVRDVYLSNGILKIQDGDVVVDLGASCGNFTNLALSIGSNVRVVALEPLIRKNQKMLNSILLNNGFKERVILINAFIGRKSSKQDWLIKEFDLSSINWISEDELISIGNLKKVDFLKCDIEGGEFDLLHKGSKLLEITNSLAIEIHSFAGDVIHFIDELKDSGFQIKKIKWDPDKSCTLLAQRV